ncbi:hypothetical protein [Herbaspirillum autotrophicum]|uniref:hypothetical protein n=1 Tax=Herbaspirillum autotrophicum TaxID=180195 RepID=UPI00067C0785|nr:hypothetical protein [Herbaspirillum autotrophicum]
MKIIRFVAEYLAPPFFDPSIENMGHLEPEDLPLTDALLYEVEKWNCEFQKTFNDAYPPDSGFKTDEELKFFNEIGHELAIKLQNFLGEEYEIIYFPKS